MAGMDLGKQVGPLPVGAWIAVVGGGLGLALYTSRKAPSPDTGDTVDESGGTGEGPGLTYVPIQGTENSDTGKPTDNDEWGRMAIDGLIALGYPAGIVNSAITKGLMGGSDYDGNKMSIQEWSIWQIALQKFGSPPTPVNVPPPTSVPGPTLPPDNPPPNNPPPPKPGTTPPHDVYVVKRGDTLSSIAKQYNTSWRVIWDFNLKYRSAATRAILKARGPNLIYAGQTFWIPKKK
jgi:LysM repeat protein